MAEHRCRQRRHVRAEPALPPPPMERAEMPMNRYISPLCPGESRPCSCPAREERVLLEQLAELSAGQNQLLMDLLGAVNALTAALLTSRAQL